MGFLWVPLGSLGFLGVSWGSLGFLGVPWDSLVPNIGFAGRVGLNGYSVLFKMSFNDRFESNHKIKINELS